MYISQLAMRRRLWYGCYPLPPAPPIVLGQPTAPPTPPEWTPLPILADLPGRTNVSTASAFSTALGNLGAGKSVVLTADISGGGATYTINAKKGTKNQPIFITSDGTSSANYRELSNCTIVVKGGTTRLVIYGLLLKGVIVRYEDCDTVQTERCWVSGFSGGFGKAALLINGTTKGRNLRFNRLTFKPRNGGECQASGIGWLNVPREKYVFENYPQFIWSERCLFTGFSAWSSTKSFQVYIGKANGDSNHPANWVHRWNLHLDDAGSGRCIENKLSESHIHGNTFERRSNGSTVSVLIRFGSSLEYAPGANPEQEIGEILSGKGCNVYSNLWVTPRGSTYSAGRLDLRHGYHEVYNNWACKLNSGEQPTVANFEAGPSAIGIWHGNLPGTYWPRNWTLREPNFDEQFFENAFRCRIGGNRMPVVSEWPDTVWNPPYYTHDNRVAPADAARTDRNLSVDLTGALNSDLTTPIPGANYNSPPVRITESVAGIDS